MASCTHSIVRWAQRPCEAHSACGRLPWPRAAVISPCTALRRKQKEHDEKDEQQRKTKAAEQQRLLRQELDLQLATKQHKEHSERSESALSEAQALARAAEVRLPLSWPAGTGSWLPTAAAEGAGSWRGVRSHAGLAPLPARRARICPLRCLLVSKVCCLACHIIHMVLLPCRRRA